MTSQAIVMNSLTIPRTLAIRLAASLLAVTAVSCIAPPPARAYRPDVSRHLDHLAHSAPTTPLPDPGAWVYEGY